MTATHLKKLKQGQQQAVMSTNQKQIEKHLTTN